MAAFLSGHLDSQTMELGRVWSCLIQAPSQRLFSWSGAWATHQWGTAKRCYWVTEYLENIPVWFVWRRQWNCPWGSIDWLGNEQGLQAPPGERKLHKRLEVGQSKKGAVQLRWLQMRGSSMPNCCWPTNISTRKTRSSQKGSWEDNPKYGQYKATGSPAHSYVTYFC